MHQGNAAHTGFVPVTLDATRFAPSWTWTLPSSVYGVISPVTVGSGKVVASVAGILQTAYLFAINEADGTAAWQYNFGSLQAINFPTVAGGAYCCEFWRGGHFHVVFNLDDGALIFRTPFGSQFEHYLAPTFKDGFIYTDGGAYGGMYRFKGRTGLQTWFANLGQYDLWTPAVDAQYAYAYTGYEFAVLDRETGVRVRTIPIHCSTGGLLPEYCAGASRRRFSTVGQRNLRRQQYPRQSADSFRPHGRHGQLAR